jgi:hypothetical protein
MIPQDQTTFGDIGNCMSACIASILEIPVSDVPNFCCVKEHPEFDPNWFCNMGNNFLMPRGYKPRFRKCPQGYSVAMGMGPRGHRHSCVALNGEIVFDPHPDRLGLETITEYMILEKIDE